MAPESPTRWDMWPRVPAKRLFKEITDLSEQGSELLLSVSEYYGVSPRSEHVDSSDHLSRAESLVGYKRCKPGDLVMNIMLAWKRGLGVSEYDDIVSPAYAVFRADTDRLYPRFCHYLLRDDAYVAEFKKFSTGVIDSRLRLYPDVFLGMSISVPPLADQTRIANFLDEKTARIDALIAEKERLVEKLEEHWASVVSQELGTSEAGGRIGWTNIPLKYVTVERCDGPFGSALTSAHYVDEGARVIRLQNIRFGEFDSTDAAYIDDDYFTRELTYHSVLEGDVLIAGLGDEKNFVGRACVAPNLGSNALVKADCFRFRVDTKRVLPEFVALQLSATARRDGGLLSSGSTRQRIPLTVTECRLLCLPTLAEQIDIVERLARRKREHSALLHHTAEHINLLREYRSSLISAAVTGQLEIAPKGFAQK